MFLVLPFFLVLCLLPEIVPERASRVRRIVGGEPAVAPPVDDPVVFTRFSGKTARVVGIRDMPHYVFRGIRYGYPPNKKERFLRPKQYLLEGFENATQFPPPCVQPVPDEDRVIGEEDCLFLNIFTPTLPTGMEGLPVIVWIHGGGFRYGSASQYGVRHLVGKQVVIVTIQYRLGSLGFLSTGSKTLPGNAGLWDMALAVQWTRNYIGFFGGNPHNIVVMGHGSGASSAISVALSKIAKGLTSGIIAMSGSSLSHFAVDDVPRNTAMEVADANGCPTASELTMIKCLQNLKADAIIKVDSMIEQERIRNGGLISGLVGRLGCAPVFEGRLDGRSLPPVSELEPLSDPERAHSKIPLLTGITKDETKRACQNQYKEQIIGNLKKIPNFVDQVLVKKLQNILGFTKDNTSMFGQLFSQVRNSRLLNIVDVNQFKNYLNYQKNNVNDGLGKISEATTDALFNVPAFLTADLWSNQDAPSFLYRFEHLGKLDKGFRFLRGLPMIGNTSTVTANETVVSHGDELAYLFDPQNMKGEKLAHSSAGDEEDNKVRDIFTQMIADFARHKKLSLGNEDVKPFSLKEASFVQVSAKPKIAKGFRFCEMGLWLGLAERLQSTTCGWFKMVDSHLGGSLGSGAKKIEDMFGGASNIGSNAKTVGGFFGGIGR